MIHPRRIALSWACIKQTRGLRSLATAVIRPHFLSSEAVTLPHWGPEPTTNQIQTSVPSREESSSIVSALFHCNITVWETTPAAARCRQLTDLFLTAFIVRFSFIFLYLTGARARHNDSTVAAFSSRVGRICTGRVHCVFPRAIWRRGWGPFTLNYAFIH